jgi:hypothetical protein
MVFNPMEAEWYKVVIVGGVDRPFHAFIGRRIGLMGGIIPGFMIEVVQKGRQANSFPEALHILQTDLDRKLILKQSGQLKDLVHQMIGPITRSRAGIPQINFDPRIKRYDHGLHQNEEWLRGLMSEERHPQRGILSLLRTGVVDSKELSKYEHDEWVVVSVMMPEGTPLTDVMELGEICGCDDCLLEDVAE